MISTTTKTLAIPGKGTSPRFEDVFNIALTGARFDLSVGVLCLTQEMLERWIFRLEEVAEEFPSATPELLDANAATLEDWEAYLCKQTYSITVLSGAREELQNCRISVDYVKNLVHAAPVGTIILA